MNEQKEFEIVNALGYQVILCETCKPYEDPFYNFADKMLEEFDLEVDGDDTARLRDALIEAFEKHCGIKFIAINDRF